MQQRVPMSPDQAGHANKPRRSSAWITSEPRRLCHVCSPSPSASTRGAGACGCDWQGTSLSRRGHRPDRSPEAIPPEQGIAARPHTDPHGHCSGDDGYPLRLRHVRAHRSCHLHAYNMRRLCSVRRMPLVISALRLGLPRTVHTLTCGSSEDDPHILPRSRRQEG